MRVFRSASKQKIGYTRDTTGQPLTLVAMKRLLLVWLLLAGVAGAAETVNAGAMEAQLAEAVKSPDLTIVHLWAPWCPNCKHELADGKWSQFIAANPHVHFVFVTVWNGADGHELLAKNGVGAQPNFTLMLHPNPSRKRGEMLSTLLGLPVSWIPTTWVFQRGRLRYALDYGELRFPMLQQMIADSTSDW